MKNERTDEIQHIRTAISDGLDFYEKHFSQRSKDEIKFVVAIMHSQGHGEAIQHVTTGLGAGVGKLVSKCRELKININTAPMTEVVAHDYMQGGLTADEIRAARTSFFEAIKAVEAAIADAPDPFAVAATMKVQNWKLSVRDAAEKVGVHYLKLQRHPTWQAAVKVATQASVGTTPKRGNGMDDPADDREPDHTDIED